jgi:Protein of unknown function (DUF4031)
MVYTDGTHLVASTLEELHEFAGKMGLHRCWFARKKKKGKPHYDLKNEKGQVLVSRSLLIPYIDIALSLGAKMTTDREVLRISKESHTFAILHCGVEQLVARRAHNPKVTGSSPVPATLKLDL